MNLIRILSLLALWGASTVGLAQQTCPENLARVAPDSRYDIDVANAVVTDLATGLMWKRCDEAPSGLECTTAAYEDDLELFLSLANNSTHAGFDDWRLPNAEELYSLVETGCFDPAINTVAFPTTVSDKRYWSSTTPGHIGASAVYVSFSYGTRNFTGKDAVGRARLVRGGQRLDSFASEADSAPDAFMLAPQLGVPLSSERTSDPIAIAGLTTVTGIGASGAVDSSYSINGGPFTSQPGAVANGDEVRVRHTSAATPGAATTTTLNIGGVTADFLSATVDVPGAPTIGTATAGNASATVTFTAPSDDGGSAIAGYTAVSSPAGGSSNCSIAELSCTVTGLTNGTAYTFTVFASNGIGDGEASAASNSVTPKAPQIIGFGSAPTVVVDGTGTVSATGGGSGNPVVFTSQTTSACTVSGTNGATVAGVTVGTCTIAANQAGDGSFTDAPEQTQSFAIDQGSQTISFAPLANKLDNDPPFSVSATGGNSSQPVTFASQTEPVCTTSGSNGSTVTLSGQLGTCTVRASQAGDVNYSAATPVDQSFEVTASNQPPTIDLPATYSMLEDGTGSVSFTVGDDLTSAADVTVEATSGNASLISDAALAQGLGGSSANRTLAFFPGANENGSAVITVTVTDGNGASEQAQLTLTVTPVNDLPSAAYGQNEVWPAGETGEKTAASFVGLTSAGPGNESDQTVSIHLAIDSDPDGVLSVASIQPNGDLTYTLTGNSGAARITLQAVDDGGTANGGVDRGEVVTRRIIVGDGIDITLSIRRGQPQSKHLGDAIAKGATMAAYSIEVRNNSAQDANGLRLQVSPIIGLTDTLWNCVISTCTPPNGSGGIDTVVDLQAGGVLLVGLNGTVDTGVPFVEITAQASLPQGVTVLLRDDDDQMFIEPSGGTGVYKSGFE